MRRQITVFTTLMVLAALGSPTVLANGPDDGEVASGVYVVGSGDGLFTTTVGDRAYLGVTLEEETESAEGGARVTRVVDDSPAHEAGLREGDVIVRFNDRTIRGPLALTRAIHDTEPGDTIALTVVRGGREQKLDVTMGEREGIRVLSPSWNEDLADRMGQLGERLGYAFSCEEGDCSWVAPDCEGEDCVQVLPRFFGSSGRPTLGVQLVEVTPELRQHLGSSEDVGVLVSKVLSGTAAEEAGIRVGDLIVSVAGESIGDTADLRRALRDKRGETFGVDVVRDNRTVTIEVTIPEPERDRPTGPRAWTIPERDARVAYRAALAGARESQRLGRAERRDAATAYERALRAAERSRRPLHLDDSI